MVRIIKCECTERHETNINSLALFKEIKEYFENQVAQHIYDDIAVETPYHIGYSTMQTICRYAAKWYRCKVCGCLWEFEYPDFPAQGFVRKFEDGQYHPK